MAAALALRQSQPFFPSLRSFFSNGWAAPLVATASLSLPRTSWSLPSLDSLLDLFPPFLLAVPKSKTSHSRKAMRSANKGLKDKRNIVNCPGCGSVKLSHNLCPNCYEQLTREWKTKNKESGDIVDLS